MGGVYVAYVPTVRKPVDGIRLEWFPSLEVCSHTLKKRISLGVSAFYEPGRPNRPWEDRPIREYPEHDDTGYMRVWRRKAVDPWPSLADRPDEEWYVAESGALVRIPWEGDDRQFTVINQYVAANRPLIHS